VALGLLVLLAWGLRAFVVAPGPFYENFHGYAVLGLDPLSVPGYPSVTSSYVALMGALSLHGDGMIAANRIGSALLVVPVTLLAVELLGGWLPGLLAGAVVAVHPLLARLGASEDPLAFYMLTLLFGVVLGRRALARDSLTGFAGAAALVSVAAFVRDATVMAGPVFAVLTFGRLPTRRRLVFVGLGLVPFAAGVLRLATFGALLQGDATSSIPTWSAWLLTALRWGAIGGLEVLRTPSAFPILALGGLGVLAWRLPRPALRLVLALGLLQGPFAVVLGSVASMVSPSRHLSPAVVLWALPIGFALAAVTRLVRAGLPKRGAAWTPVVAVVLLGASISDARPLLTRTTYVEQEYQVMKDCLRQLPAEARYQRIAEGPASHVASEPAWLRAERPLWKPLDERVLFDDRWAGRHVPAVLLIDHSCTLASIVTAVPDFSAATDDTPWGLMVPACAEAFRAREWQTVVRVDLPFDDTQVGDAVGIPVGCLIEASEVAP